MHRRLAGQTYFDGDLLYFAEAAGAVADPPAKTDPAPAKTEGAADGTPGGTAAADGGAQPDASGAAADKGGAAGESDGTPPEPTPTELAINAQRKSDAIRMANRLGIEGDFDNVEAVETALAERDEVARQEALDAEVSTAYTDKLRTIIDNLRGLETTSLDANDNEVKTRLLSEEDIQKLVAGPINGLQTAIRDIERTDSYNVIASAVIDLLPDEASINKWAAEAGGGKAFGPWLEVSVEHLAPLSKWGKQQAADKAAFGASEYDRGVAFREGAPPGTVSQSGAKGRPAATGDGKTLLEKAGALADGSLDFAAEAERLGLKP